MNSVDSLNILLQRAEAERDTALATLQAARAAADAAQAKTSELYAYRNEYQRRWTQQFGKQGAIEIVHCYQSFNDRLDQAIEYQLRIAKQTQAGVERAVDELRQRELRVASVKKLIERRESEARRQADRQEQKQTDESAQRAGWFRGAAPVDVTPF